MSEAFSELETWLHEYVTAHDGVAGTIHQRNGEELELRAAVNIPPKVVQTVQRIPKGKGMAGLAWERDEAVSTCNLKTDETGDVRPGAKAVDAAAAVAVPIHDAKGEVRGVVGIAYQGERDMTHAELAELTRKAEALSM